MSESADKSIDHTKELLDGIFLHPKSEDEFTKEASLGRVLSNTGVVTFSTKDEFVEALKYAQSKFSWLSDEWVKETIEHEDEHLNEARKRFGDRATYKYKLQAIDKKNGNLGIAGGFYIHVHGITQEEMDNEHKIAILTAPKKKSAGDKRGSGIDLNSDISNENGWK